MAKAKHISDSATILPFRPSANLQKVGVVDPSNPAHGPVLLFPNTAHVRHSKAQRIAPLPAKAARAQRLNGKIGPRAAASEARAAIRSRIADVAKVLNLAGAAVKPAMTAKHEHLATFAKKHGIKIEWLIAGTGSVFRSRGELFELAIEFERLVRIEKDLGREHSRQRRMGDRLAYEKLEIDPDDRNACSAVHDGRVSFEAWKQANEAADRETSSSGAWTKWNNAVNRRVKAGKELKKRFGPPRSQLGLLIRLRLLEVIEDQDDVADLMMAEIRAFFARGRAGKIAADCGH